MCGRGRGRMYVDGRISELERGRESGRTWCRGWRMFHHQVEADDVIRESPEACLEILDAIRANGPENVKCVTPRLPRGPRISREEVPTHLAG